MNSAWSRPQVVEQAAAPVAQKTEALGLVVPRPGEADRRAPRKRPPRVLAAADVEGAIDEHVEDEARPGAELEHAHAALDAVSERDEPHPGHLVETTDVPQQVGRRIGSPEELRHARQPIRGRDPG